jgi:hypothetical protein
MRTELHDGRILAAEATTFLGTPDQPFEDHHIERKFRTLCAQLPDAEALLAQLQGG